MPSMSWMLRCTKNSIISRKDVRSAHLSHPCRIKLMGVERKIRHLLQFSTLASVQNLARAPIDDGIIIHNNNPFSPLILMRE